MVILVPVPACACVFAAVSVRFGGVDGGEGGSGGGSSKVCVGFLEDSGKFPRMVDVVVGVRLNCHRDPGCNE